MYKRQRLHSAFVASAHAAVLAASARGADGAVDAQLWDEWAHLDTMLSSLLAGHEPASRASRVQGAALARVGELWLRAGGASMRDSAGARLLERAHAAPAASSAASALSGVHAATVFGALAAALAVPPTAAVRAHAFVGARDALSAAIRLDLVGPLHAVELMASLRAAAADGERAAEHAARRAIVRAGLAPRPAADGTWELSDALAASRAARLIAVRHAAGAAPVLDTLHACHDLLEMRLFQT